MSTQSRQSRVITQAIGFRPSPRASRSRLRRRCGRDGCVVSNRSAQLRLFVDDVLAHDGVVLLDLELVRRVLPVLDGRVEVTGAGARLELDDLALASLRHGPFLRRIRHALAGRREDAHAPAVLHERAYPASLAVAAEHHHVGGVDEAFLLDDTARARAAPAGLQVMLLDTDLLDADAAALAVDRHHAPRLPAIGALRDAHQIALANAEGHDSPCLLVAGRKTSRPLGQRGAPPARSPRGPDSENRALRRGPRLPCDACCIASCASLRESSPSSCSSRPPAGSAWDSSPRATRWTARSPRCCSPPAAD